MFQLAASLKGAKIIMPGEKPPELKNFIETLPRSRWWDSANAHACDATPATAWRIIAKAPVPVLPSDDVLELSHRFLKRYEEYTDNGDEPAIRRGDSWEHQRRAYWYAWHRDAALFDMFMGTGKSKPTCELVTNKGARKTLILCPVSVIGVWRRELNKWGNPEGCEVLLLDKKSWKNERKAEAAAAFLTTCAARGLRSVVVMNYESAWLEAFATFSLGVDWDIVICDESHRIANADTNVSKYAEKLGRVAKYKLCLTGTPLSKDPLSVFGQARFLDPGVFGSSWARFRNRYGVSGHFGADQIVAYKNLDELSELMSLFTFSVGKEVLDLPEIVETDYVVQFEPKAAKIYEHFEAEQIAHFGDDVLTASNALVKGLRLQQMTSGQVPVDDDAPEGWNKNWNWEDDTGETQKKVRRWELISTAKRDALEAFLKDLDPGEPVVVFCKFTQDLVALREIAKKTKRRYGEISGAARDLTPNAEMPDDVDLMGVQIQSGGVGIDLTRARYVFYYSVGHRLSDFEQSLSRSWRPGQERTVFVYHIVIEGTIDEAIYRALAKRQEVNAEVINYLKDKQQLTQQKEKGAK
jgi:SNF2 family DNA or RNA helicase